MTTKEFKSKLRNLQNAGAPMREKSKLKLEFAREHGTKKLKEVIKSL